jgi:putative flavoprotein involved in K+ transport
VLSAGAPLIRVKSEDLAAAGVERVRRTVGVRDGLPLLEDGRVAEVANVIWCTGFRDDFSWIDLPITGDDGAVEHERGVATRVPGLYFVGLMFQYAMTSDTITGVSRDAAYVVEQLVSRAPAREEARVS